MNARKIFPMAINFEVKNFAQYFKTPTITNVYQTRERKIYFLDAASYNNLGDQAIAYSMAMMLKKISLEHNYRYVEISETYLLRNLKKLKSVIATKDVICLSGGGNMGNLYPKYESLRRKIIKSFPNNRIIIFPQTIDYDEDSYGKRELKNSERIYRNHSDLIICAREKKSYLKMKEIYDRVLLVPDIVLYLCKGYEVNKQQDTTCVGVCLRSDDESTLSEEQKSYICEIVKQSDLKINKFTTMANNDMIFNSDNREAEIKKKIGEIQRNSLVITDRLHGMIFSILAGIPCIAIDNKNRKLSGVYETIKDMGVSVRFIDTENISAISILFTEMINTHSVCPNLDQKFKKLERIIIERE